MAARSQSGSAKRVKVNTPPPPYWVTSAAAVGIAGNGYHLNDAIWVNAGFTWSTWTGLVHEVDEAGSILSIRTRIKGYTKISPVAATFNILGGHGRGGRVTFTYTHVVP